MAEKLEINVTVTGTRQAQNDLNKLKRGFKDIGRGLAGVSNKISGVTLAAGAALGALGVSAVRTAAEFEQVQIGLEGTLGSAKEAQRIFNRLKEEAKRTPFELRGLGKFTQLLSTATKDGDEAVDLILDLGDALAFAGKGEAELSRIVANMQQIQATGRASLLDIRQFGFAGIPIFELLAEETGKTGEALSEFISAGKVDFDLLQRIFRKSADEGGRFFDAMERQSKTLSGTLSNVRDTIDIALTEIATESGLFEFVRDVAQDFLVTFQENLPAIKQFASALVNGFKQAAESIGNFLRPFLEFAKNNPDVILQIAKLAVQITAMNAAFRISRFLFGDVFTIGKGLVTVLRNWNVAQGALNVTMGVSATALAGIAAVAGAAVASFVIIKKSIDDTTAAQDRLTESFERSVESRITAQQRLANITGQLGTGFAREQLGGITKAGGFTQMGGISGINKLTQIFAEGNAEQKRASQILSKMSRGIQATKQETKLVKRQIRIFQQQQRQQAMETLGALRNKFSGVLSPFAKLSNALGFQSGGIVPGNSMSGDKQIIRANSGEMILNRSQQANLFRMLSRPSVNFNAPISFGGGGGRMQQENNFTQLLMQAAR